MKTGAVLRPMQQADAEGVSTVLCACYRFLCERENYSSRQLSELLEMHSSDAVEKWRLRWDVIVAECEGAVVGVVAVRDDEIEELFVHPLRHRLGIGALLFAAAEKLIADGAHPRLVVHTTGYASPFYEAMGARRVGSMTCDRGPLLGRKLIRHEKALG